MSLSASGRQLSLFGVEASDPSPTDLAGLLAGPGQVVRMGGTARVSVVVDAAWRVHVLVAEMAARGLSASWVRTADTHLGVRTSYARGLAPLGAAWLRGAVKRPPADFRLDGPRLRLWVAAAGTPGPLGFLLRLGPSDEECWAAVGAALAAVGLPAVLVTPRMSRQQTRDGDGPESAEDDRPEGEREGADPRVPAVGAGSAGASADTVAGPGTVADTDDPHKRPDSGVSGLDRVDADTPGAEDHVDPVEGGGDPAEGCLGSAVGEPPGSSPIGGPAYRITGRRRLARLAELVGERPAAAPVDAWPG